MRLRQFIVIVYRSVNELCNFLSTATPSFSWGFSGNDISTFPWQSCRFLPHFIVQDFGSLHTKTEAIFHEGYHPLLLRQICKCYFVLFPSLRSNNGFLPFDRQPQITLYPKQSQNQQKLTLAILQCGWQHKDSIVFNLHSDLDLENNNLFFTQSTPAYDDGPSN